jgi:ribosomal protein L9
MRVLLIQDVPGLGKEMDLLDVDDHFARNELQPNRKALTWTLSVQRRYKNRKINDRTSPSAA